MPDTTSRPRGATSALLTSLDRQLTGNLADPEHRESVVRIAKAIRGESDATAARLDEFWLSRVASQQTGLRKAAQQQEALKELFETLTRPPLRIATFLGSALHGGVPTALVHHEGASVIVGLAEDVAVSGISIGRHVLLNHDRNLLLGVSPYPATRCGETAAFSRSLPGGRLVLRWRDEEVLVRSADDLDPEALDEGDRVLWDSRLGMAFEKVDRPTESSFFLEDTPSQTFEDVGGLDAQIDRLKRSIRLRRQHPDVVRRYRLKQVRSILMVGPPGTGKTLLARAFANWIADLSPSGRSRFMNVKPASLHSPWYAESEANYREVFRIAREAGKADPDVPVIMFFDEIDSVGSSRTASSHRVNDRVLTALMTELDGLEDRGNVLVLAATNRADALDPALLRPGRLKDLLLEVPRPDRGAAVHILEKHLSPDIPYHTEVSELALEGAGGQIELDGAAAAAVARSELIETAVSRLFAPNADTDLATLTLRDGKQRTVTARDLVSGAVLENIARAAVELACAREVDSGSSGLARSDVLEAIATELETAVRAVAPHNAKSFIDGLPEDIDVVRVDRVESRARRIHRYLEVA